MNERNLKYIFILVKFLCYRYLMGYSLSIGFADIKIGVFWTMKYYEWLGALLWG